MCLELKFLVYEGNAWNGELVTVSWMGVSLENCSFKTSGNGEIVEIQIDDRIFYHGNYLWLICILFLAFTCLFMSSNNYTLAKYREHNAQ